LRSTRLVAIDHVQLGMPSGGEGAARAFYGSLLGLEEVPKPPALAARGGVWFTAEGVAVHLGVEAEFRPAAKAHPAFVVDDLAALRERLAGAGAAPIEDDTGLGVDRCYVMDPFGNRLELIDARDAGFSAQAARA
jgi:catechol 2,3-dioxygenase-like lactoylglutathione lyase family enzyme